ncbi:TIGR02281 family clan AA aspartic protease [uncultured Rhodoferax sp.]|uniref:retropepsin-like aspartic protease family protein n=1 Tax=uncultured Rhodoferax sp. TaxID=223188 RepID=UPI0025CC5DCD|nr:TIGR02281 family clan AA aspartic protease [uncultured Rhodoferax sp.]
MSASPNPPSDDLPTSLKWGPLAIVLVWLAVIGVLYLVSAQYLKPKPVVTLPGGALVIPMARDGHFYAAGTVAGQPVRFLVDTGASMVVVSEALAKQAGLVGGTPTVFKTANGDLAGSIHMDVPVALASAQVSAVRVGVGLVGGDPDEALLGQSFLNKFDITLSDRQMTLRPKAN